MVTGYSFVTARVKECVRTINPAVWLWDSVEKSTTSNRLQQATARGAVLRGRAELLDAFRAVTDAVPGSYPAQFAMGTLKNARSAADIAPAHVCLPGSSSSAQSYPEEK